MRLTVIALFLALCVAPLSAQRHGGGFHGGSFHGGGFHGGGGFHQGGGFHGGSFFGGQVGFGGPRFGGRVFLGSRHGFFPHRSRGFSRFSVGFFSYSYPYYPYYYAYPYYAYPYGQPYYVDRGSDYQDDRVSRQLDDLRSDVRDLKDENERLRYDLSRQRNSESHQSEAEPSMRARPESYANRPQAEPPTVIILNDGRRFETRSYAVADGTLWILSPDRAQKVPLAQIDVEKSRRVNAGRGVDFQIAVTK
jgi:hypothetical protein